jgi:hypothetical protein
VDFSRALRLLAGDSSGLGRAVARLRPLDVSTRMTRSSTFDLTTFDPGLRYLLGLGGLDDFLAQENDLARGAAEARVATVSGGADLPYGLTFTISHALTRTTRFQRVAEAFTETETNQREWPVGSVRWSHTFRGGLFSLLALGTTFRHREGGSVQSNRSGPAALTSITSSSLTPDMQLGFRNGVTITLGLNDLDQENVTSSSETQLEQRDFTGSMNYAFRLPRSLSRSRKQVRSSVSYLQTSALTCLQGREQVECTVVSDVRRKEIRGGLDMDLLSALSASLQTGYSVNDARHLSRRTSQISIIASFQLSLFAGDYR